MTLPFANTARRLMRRCAAFTMVEIALCLAIIGFGLVAIIGVLPTGLNVQRDNREETIIIQDAAVWIDAIRNGSFGYDDLTNYVVKIENHWGKYSADSNAPPILGVDTYTPTNSTITSITGAPDFPLVSSARIIGLLSTPKRLPLSGFPYQSNYFVAHVRSISGSAAEKYPQRNPALLDLGFSYRMIVEMIPYVPFDYFGTNVLYTPTNQALARMALVDTLQANSHDLRLTFRWPLLPGDRAGNGRQTFRTFVGGTIWAPSNSVPPLFFLQPSTHVHPSAPL